MHVLRVQKSPGFICVELKQIVIVSCYFSPNKNIEEFKTLLNNLETCIKTTKKNLILEADLNAKTPIIGSSTCNAKGRILEDWISANGLLIVNKGNTNTFNGKNGSSLIDFTACTNKIATYISGWHVELKENFSDHSNIRFTLKGDGGSVKKEKNTLRWIVTEEGLRKVAAHFKTLTFSSLDPNSLVDALKKSCDKHLKTKGKNKHREVYWWTQEIAELRKTCNLKRRNFTRLRSEGLHTEKQAALREYKKSKKKLNYEIKNSKQKKWKELCDDLQQNIWDTAYKIALKRLRKTPPPVDVETAVKEIDKLFPHKPVTLWHRVKPTIQYDTEFTEEEILNAANKIKPKKAPGPDNIPPEVVKACILERPNVSRNCQWMPQNRIFSASLENCQSSLD